MKITPRKNELAAIVEILEAAKSFEDAARAVYKRAAEVLAMRDTWAFVPEGMGVAVGPYGSRKEAEEVASRISTSYRIVPLSPPGRLEGNLDGAEWSGYCCSNSCTHARFMHLMDGTSYGKCSDKKCSCGGWRERK